MLHVNQNTLSSLVSTFMIEAGNRNGFSTKRIRTLKTCKASPMIPLLANFKLGHSSFRIGF